MPPFSSPRTPPPKLQTDSAQLIREYIAAASASDVDAMLRYCAPDVRITLPGGLQVRDPRDIAPHLQRRYHWVKRRVDRFDVSPHDREMIVYCFGMQYGEWLDGEVFSGCRFVDRYVVRQDKIVQIEQWDDGAEKLLAKAGLTAIVPVEPN